jgi:hypothetical protein
MVPVFSWPRVTEALRREKAESITQRQSEKRCVMQKYRFLRLDARTRVLFYMKQRRKENPVILYLTRAILSLPILRFGPGGRKSVSAIPTHEPIEKYY